MGEHIVIGTCSICGGPVQLPKLWMGTVPPIPTCADCGGKQRGAHGPVIEMEKPRSTTSTEYFIGKHGVDHA